MHNKEDYESLLGSNRVTLNYLITSAYTAFPFLLVACSAVSITIASAMFDEAINVWSYGFSGVSTGSQFYVSLLPAIDKDMKPIPDTELIRISHGYALCLVLALAYGAVFGPKRLSRGTLTSCVAILCLFCGVALQLRDQL